MTADFCHICDFSSGAYRITTGGITLVFEDSDRFGPSKLNARNGDLSEISDRHRWFWEWYPRWRAAGKPTTGQTQSTPSGTVEFVDLNAQLEPVA
jgi:hypothetical protein